MKTVTPKLSALILTLIPFPALAAATDSTLDFTAHWTGIVSIVFFVAAYALVISEETIHLRKSKPVMVVAGIIWLLVSVAYTAAGQTEAASAIVRHNLLEYGELFLFLLAAMTYINAMEERGVFDTLRAWLVNRGFSLLVIYWITGLLAFVISPVADNLTTALLMATVIMAVGGKYHGFVALGCINIVVAANAGGAFSPFGDITTLMVWQEGKLDFLQFFSLIVPSTVNWIIPAFIMSLKIPRQQPDPLQEEASLAHGAWFVVGLFIATIAMAVSFHNVLHLPPVIGMMTGLGLLKLFGYYLKQRDKLLPRPGDEDLGDTALSMESYDQGGYDYSRAMRYNIFKSLERAEWDTLMFFYGIILCVGGLGALGYLATVSEIFYVDLGTTYANILVGLVSALLDNIPVMFAVLTMDPAMNSGQWLLVTLTAGVGGSLLSIGSVAGVAVMGQARGIYTFMTHLKWTWAIAVGYAAGIAVHMLLNRHLF
ncbi:MAG: Na(+)/H(+) antiporter NhaD [Gammaproteobacteria bacterium]|nr:Na(+)/H(+) antiporter NhaD [Gammaproteobacteria bacterium]